MAVNIAVSEECLIELQTATKEDPDMAALMNIIQRGQPEEQRQVPLNRQAYFPFKEKLSAQNGLIFKGEREVLFSTRSTFYNCIVPRGFLP